MAKDEKDEKTWIERHWQWLVAAGGLAATACSLWISLNTLQATLDQQKIENEYRESSIRPKVAIVHDYGAPSTTLVNNGLGPAELKRIVVGFGQWCIDSFSTADWSIATAAAPATIEQFLFAKILDQMRSQNPTSFGEIHIAEPGYVLGAGASYLIARWGVATGTSAATKPGTAASLARIAELYREQIGKLRLQIEYCSMSGRYCSRTGTPGPIGCP
jgi:hypothetical protein